LNRAGTKRYRFVKHPNGCMSLRTGVAGGTLPSVGVRTASRSRSSAQLHPLADASWHMNRHDPVPRFACLAEPIKARTTGPIEPRANALLHPLWGASRLNGFQALKRHTARSPSCSLTQPRFLDERVAALHLLVPLCHRGRVGSDGIRIARAIAGCNDACASWDRACRAGNT